MAYKKMIKINFLLCVFVVSCSGRGVAPVALPENAGIEGADTLSPPLIQQENLPEEEISISQSSAPSLRDVEIAFYIDAIGYDAFAPLGFAEELEKVGIKPRKIVGTGFGCWVALSWALSGSGNQAEWQSFKWTRWELIPKKGIIDRIKGALGADERFYAEVEKHFSVNSFDQLKVPADCPLVENRGTYGLLSARDMKMSELLWQQFLTPALGVPDTAFERSPLISGVFSGFPTDSEWDVMSDRMESEKPILWIYLRSWNLDERRVGITNSTLLSVRKEMPSHVFHRTARGNYWMSFELAPAHRRNIEALQNPAGRRRLLLDGRKAAKRILEEDYINKTFVSFFEPEGSAEVPVVDSYVDSESQQQVELSDE